jgi:hypothetical protein
MLVLHPELRPYFRKVCETARKAGPEMWAQLKGGLRYLHDYANQNGDGKGPKTCHLWKDFAPLSFTFVMKRADVYWFNGGFIYQGPLQDGVPNWTCSLHNKPGWFVHT